MNKIKMLDQIEDACVRAERNGKDKDLIIALRALYFLLKESIKNEQQKAGD